MAGAFDTVYEDVTQVWTQMIPVTPADNTPFTKGPARGVWIGTAGNLAFQDLTGTTRTVAVLTGLFPCAIKGVNSTGTTASGIFAGY